MTYLDNAATTYPKSEAVYQEMDRINRKCAVNAGRGSYALAREASGIIEDTRCRLLKLFHAEEIADVAFTPSVTHALNQIIRGLGLKHESVVYITPYEHNAVVRVLHQVKEITGCKIEQLPLNEELKIDLDQTEYMFSVKKPDVVIATAISNVTGYVLPFKDVFSLAKEYEAVTVLDASQAAGLIELNMKTDHADIICFAGHKTLYGPFGIAGFTLRKNIVLDRMFAGGTGSDSLNPVMPEKAPARYEAASQNVTAIGGLRASLCEEDIDDHYRKVLKLTEYALNKLTELDNINLMGAYDAGETLGIISFVVAGYDSNDVGMILDQDYDIAVRTGYHCAPYIHDYLHDKASNGTVRIGIGKYNSPEDIDLLIEALESL